MLFARLILLIALLAPAPGAQGQVRDLIDRIQSNPLILLADRIRISLTSQVVELSGRVRLATEDTSVHADRVHVTDSSIELEGRVKITTPDQDLYADRLYYDQATLELRLENAFLRDAQRYVTARLIQQTSDSAVTADEVLYSPCPECYPGRRLPWQIYVRQARYDPEDEQIRLRDAQLVIFGQPILRIPYWQLVNPAIERWSGYLQPVLRSSDAGGTGLQLGQFWALDDHQDMTAWVTLHSKSAVEGGMRYRWANPSARFSAHTRLSGLIDGGQAHDYFADTPNWQGDISLDGDWFITPRLRMRGQGRFASHDDFGQGFGHDTADYARAFMELEYFHRRAYGRLTLSQDQQQTNDANAPYNQDELPYRLTLKWHDRQDWGPSLDGFWGMDLNSAIRETGRSSARLASYGGLSLPSMPLAGGWLTTETFVLGTAAQAEGLDTLSDAFVPAAPNFDGSATSLMMGGSLDWALPLHHRGMAGLSLTPRVRLTTLDGTAPDGRTANEDARLPFLTSATLWRSAYQGPYDRLQTGRWADMGLGLDHVGDVWTSHMFTGLRAYDDGGQSHGLLSAHFTRADAGLTIAYAGRVPTTSAQANSHDVSVQTPVNNGDDPWTLTLDYGLEGAQGLANAGENAGLTFAGPLSSHWRASLDLSQNLLVEDDALVKAVWRYADCCLGLNFYSTYDQNQGDPVVSVGFELELIGLTTLGSQNLASF